MHENVEITRRAYRAFNRAGVEAILEFLHPEIEWHMADGFARRPRVLHGHDGVRQVLSMFEENFDDFRVEPGELIEEGDVVIAPVHMHGRAKGTGEEHSFDVVHVWEAQAGRAFRLSAYSSVEEALSAVRENEAMKCGGGAGLP